MRLTLSEIAACLNAPPPAVDGEVLGYSIDSRSLQPGELFFALRGSHVDGHDFMAAAFQKGAIAAVAAPGRTGADEAPGVVLAVEDPGNALRSLARHARRRWGKPVVAITGSNGKTTTKEALSALLQTRLRVSKTSGNFNNELGLPLSLLRFDDDAEIGVVELAMNHAGEIRRLASIAEPAVGLVTNVSAAHLEFFGSVNAIAEAKRELIECLPDDGIAVLNADDSRVRRFADFHRGRSVLFGIDQPADFAATDVRLEGDRGATFTVQPPSGGRGTRFESPLLGRHNVSNVLGAIATASLFGIEPETLVDAVRRLQPFEMRGELRRVGEILVVSDCYNANPTAMKIMLDMLGRVPGRRRIAVLGEMRELGPTSAELHGDLGREAARSGLDLLIGVQGHARAIVEEAVQNGFPSEAVHFFESVLEAGEFLAAHLQPGDVVLLKASRAVGLERALGLIERRAARS